MIVEQWERYAVIHAIKNYCQADNTPFKEDNLHFCEEKNFPKDLNGVWIKANGRNNLITGYYINAAT